MFQNAFLHLLQTIMVFVQCLFCIDKAQIIRRINAPRQTKHRLQIVQLHAIVGRLGMGTFQLIHLFQERSLHLITPFDGLRLLTHLLYFLLLTAATQLILNGFNLLLQEILTLLLVYILTCTHLDRLFDFGKLHFTIQNLKQAVGTRPQRVDTEQFYLFVFLEWQVRTDKVYQKHWIGNVLDGKCRILRKHIG